MTARPGSRTRAWARIARRPPPTRSPPPGRSGSSSKQLCHTRELAFQISNEFDRFSRYLPDVKCKVFYGGVPVPEHKRILKSECPHVIVGTPGRILQLVREKELVTKGWQANKVLMGKEPRTFLFSEQENDAQSFMPFALSDYARPFFSRRTSVDVYRVRGSEGAACCVAGVGSQLVVTSTS